MIAEFIFETKLNEKLQLEACKQLGTQPGVLDHYLIDH